MVGKYLEYKVYQRQVGMFVLIWIMGYKVLLVKVFKVICISEIVKQIEEKERWKQKQKQK